jgi:hypothetical protein
MIRLQSLQPFLDLLFIHIQHLADDGGVKLKALHTRRYQ